MAVASSSAPSESASRLPEVDSRTSPSQEMARSIPISRTAWRSLPASEEPTRLLSDTASSVCSNPSPDTSGYSRPQEVQVSCWFRGNGCFLQNQQGTPARHDAGGAQGFADASEGVLADVDAVDHYLHGIAELCHRFRTDLLTSSNPPIEQDAWKAGSPDFLENCCRLTPPPAVLPGLQRAPGFPRMNRRHTAPPQQPGNPHSGHRTRDMYSPPSVRTAPKPVP